MNKQLNNGFQAQTNVSRIGRKIFFSGDVCEESIYELRKILAEIEDEDNETGFQDNAEKAIGDIACVLESESEEATAEENNYITKVINTYKKSIKKPNSLDRTPIHLHINTRGGDAYECLGVIDVISNMKTPVWAYTYKAMSAGFFIFISCDKRFMYENGTLLYHQVSSGSYGTVMDMIDDTNEMVRLQEKVEDITLASTYISVEKLVEVRDKKIDWYIDAETALELGICDEII